MELGTIVALALGLPIGVLLAAFAIMWARRSSRRARISPDGFQELEIVVLGGYKPDAAVVGEGVPVRLKFTRLETEECSGRVIFSGLKFSRHLPPYRSTSVEFMPPARGEYLFTSDMGMYQGRLIVEAAETRPRLPYPFSRQRRSEPRAGRLEER